MDAKSLEMLEFPHIREILAGYTTFSASRALAGTLCPLQDYDTISRLLEQSAEARRLLDSEGGFSVGGVLDVRDKVKIAALEGILDAVSLVEIQQTLFALHELRRYLKGLADDYPLLWEIAGGIAELRQIEKDIGDCLDPAGEVLDTASPPWPISAASYAIRGRKSWKGWKRSSGRRAASACSRRTSSPSARVAMSSLSRSKSATR